MEPDAPCAVTVPSSEWLTETTQGMSEEDAMELLVKTVLPEHIWDGSSNRQLFVITHRDNIPTDRQYRNAWRLAA